MAGSDEGKLFRFTLRHSIILTIVMALVTLVFAYCLPQFVPQAAH
jgi:L-lactate permease